MLKELLALSVQAKHPWSLLEAFLLSTASYSILDAWQDAWFNVPIALCSSINEKNPETLVCL